MNGKYQVEIDNFIRRFEKYRDLRIVLYGIGRYTATLLEGLKGFCIVGLMDKDPANTGKVVQGIPIVDKETAEKTADMVVINTAETYWGLIYNRIKDIKIPIYYINGEQAKEKEDRKADNPFQKLSYVELTAKVENAEIISFDFFDTLFLRSVCSSQDIFRIMEKQLRAPVTQMRNRAKKHVQENYSLDELYGQIEIAEKVSHEQIIAMKHTELTLEKKLLVPRTQILLLLRDLLESNKDIFIISDMYLPKCFYTDVLNAYGIALSDKAILLSNELNANKLDGTLWEYYAVNIVKGRAALHVGDNVAADVEKPMEYGIQTYLTPNVWDMFLHSSLKDAAPNICSTYAAGIMGCVLDSLFENPFSLNTTGGVPAIKNSYDMGYSVFGPIILTFLLWLLNKTRTDSVETLVFMSRDGYFLKEDFEYLCELLGKKQESCYIGISRQLAMMASIETKQDLVEYMQMPYTGSVTEMLEDRFGISCTGCENIECMDRHMDQYLPEMKKRVAEIRKNYLHYLEQFTLDNRCAIVDIGYYGNNQRYLNKLLQLDMSGYYFNANLSNGNKNKNVQKMMACFQSNNDMTGENSQVLKKQIYLESFLTAPYGMVKAIDEQGSFVCAPDGKNQEYFQDKEEINRGVKQLIADYVERFGEIDMEPDPIFADQYYGICFGGGLEFSDEIRQSFYNDNAMMNRLESSLFY